VDQTCLDENTVVRFVAGTLPAAEVARVDAHVDQCAECRAVLVHAVRNSTVGATGQGTAATEPAEGMVVEGKYQIEQLIGRGGMGTVHRALDLALDRRVALKFMRSDVAREPAATTRFVREGRAAARLHSPHACRVYELGTFGDRPYIVMELLEGETLQRRMERDGPMPPARACELILSVIEAVGEAHAARIVHRDLKPANLFLARAPDGTETIKVLDFGLSKLTTPEPVSEVTTDSRALLGSPNYMAPEQLRSARSVDHRADVWSLGCILYHLVVGRPPFASETLPDLIAAVIGGEPGFAGTALPPDLVAVIEGCLQKDRDRRIASVEALAAGLRPFCTRSPQSTAARRLRPWVPVLCGAIAVAAVATMSVRAPAPAKVPAAPSSPATPSAPVVPTIARSAEDRARTPAPRPSHRALPARPHPSAAAQAPIAPPSADLGLSEQDVFRSRK
jgi:serine/threonine-protein kinase